MQPIYWHLGASKQQCSVYCRHFAMVHEVLDLELALLNTWKVESLERLGHKYPGCPTCVGLSMGSIDGHMHAWPMCEHACSGPHTFPDLCENQKNKQTNNKHHGMGSSFQWQALTSSFYSDLSFLHVFPASVKAYPSGKGFPKIFMPGQNGLKCGWRRSPIQRSGPPRLTLKAWLNSPSVRPGLLPSISCSKERTVRSMVKRDESERSPLTSWGILSSHQGQRQAQSSYCCVSTFKVKANNKGSIFVPLEAGFTCATHVAEWLYSSVCSRTFVVKLDTRDVLVTCQWASLFTCALWMA